MTFRTTAGSGYSHSVALQLRDVTVRFDETVALDAVSCRFEAGTSSALIGTNGSGKSTLLNVIAELVTPSSGTVTRPPAGRVAFVLQQQRSTHWVPLTAGEVLHMGRFAERGLLGRFRRADNEVLAAAAAALDLDDNLLDRQFGELSGGQRQRVLVAQALAQEPDILLLDEPITGLDIPSQHAILRIIEERTAAGTIVLLSTHDLEEARHCDQVLLIDNAIVAAGTPDEVLTPSVLSAAFGDRVFDHH